MGHEKRVFLSNSSPADGMHALFPALLFPRGRRGAASGVDAPLFPEFRGGRAATWCAGRDSFSEARSWRKTVARCYLLRLAFSACRGANRYTQLAVRSTRSCPCDRDDLSPCLPFNKAFSREQFKL